MPHPIPVAVAVAIVVSCNIRNAVLLLLYNCILTVCAIAEWSVNATQCSAVQSREEGIKERKRGRGKGRRRRKITIIACTKGRKQTNGEWRMAEAHDVCRLILSVVREEPGGGIILVYA